MEQPALPEGVPWPSTTVRWWAAWAGRDYTAVEWEELLTAALIHAQVWSGDFARAGELRLRLEKFGATPLDALKVGDGSKPVEQQRPVNVLDEIAARRAARGAATAKASPSSVARSGSRRRG